MKIKGQGKYENTSGIMCKVLGTAEILESSVESVDVNGRVDFSRLDVKSFRVSGNSKGECLKSEAVEVCGNILVSKLDCGKLKISGNVAVDELVTKRAKLVLGGKSRVENIKAETALSISMGDTSGNFSLHLNLPFLKLDVDNLKSSGNINEDGYSKIEIGKIFASAVDLDRCKIGELVCSGGTLKDCYVETLICKNDVNLLGDCTIVNRKEA